MLTEIRHRSKRYTKFVTALRPYERVRIIGTKYLCGTEFLVTERGDLLAPEFYTEIPFNGSVPEEVMYEEPFSQCADSRDAAF